MVNCIFLTTDYALGTGRIFSHASICNGNIYWRGWESTSWPFIQNNSLEKAGECYGYLLPPECLAVDVQVKQKRKVLQDSFALSGWLPDCILLVLLE